MPNKAIIVSAPSGAGKTTLVHKLLNEKDLGLEFSISACSRAPRAHEVDGKDYYFLSAEAFEKAIAANRFIEWEQVYERHYYGTLKKEVERIWKNGKTVIFDVDVVGGLNLKKAFGEHALAVFIMPPNAEVLEQRLRNRATETEDKILMRVRKAKSEIEKANDFDVTVVNDDLTQAFSTLKTHVINFLNQPQA